MRFIFLIFALLATVAAFPLPIATHVTLPSISLQNILEQGHDLTELDMDHEPRIIVLDDTPARVSSASLPEREPDAGAQPVPLSEEQVQEEKQRVERLAASTPPPSRPQAVISTGFEKNGLSESSFRTVAKAQKNIQPPNEKVLVIGDSLSIPLGKQLEDYFSKIPGVYFKRLGKVSSGLARPDFFDWERTLDKLAATMQPNTVVIMIGTNDNQSLKRGDGTTVHFGDSAWDAEYKRRMNKLFELCVQNNPDVQIFWVGAPIMGRPDLTKDVERINQVVRSLCDAEPNCRFIDTWDALADEHGRFTNHIVDISGERIRVRANDGVHLSLTGANIIAGRCLQTLEKSLPLLRARPDSSS
jgi:hypothetical protein